MSFEDEENPFGDGPKPEDIFSMVTIMPKRKLKVTAHLEDKDGDVVLVADLAEDLVKYINSQMRLVESTPVNSQLFPMAGQFMTSIVPRFIGIPMAGLILEAGTFRHAVLTFGLASMLFMQYVQQHGLKIVTTTTDLTDEEVESYLDKANNGDKRLRSAMQEALGVGPDEEPEDN